MDSSPLFLPKKHRDSTAIEIPEGESTLFDGCLPLGVSRYTPVKDWQGWRIHYEDVFDVPVLEREVEA